MSGRQVAEQVPADADLDEFTNTRTLGVSLVLHRPEWIPLPDETPAQRRKREYLKHTETFDKDVWLRSYATDPARAFVRRRLDPHTLLEPKDPNAIDPALLEDPLTDA